MKREKLILTRGSDYDVAHCPNTQTKPLHLAAPAAAVSPLQNQFITLLFYKVQTNSLGIELPRKSIKVFSLPIFSFKLLSRCFRFISLVQRNFIPITLSHYISKPLDSIPFHRITANLSSVSSLTCERPNTVPFQGNPFSLLY